MHLSEPTLKSEQKSSQNESRSYHRSANDLSYPQTPEFTRLNTDKIIDSLTAKQKVKRTDANSHQDSRTLLKRFAPGQTSGYYLSQRHYHSLPHHYKLPTSISGHTSLPIQSSTVEKNNSDSVPFSEFSQKLAIILDWFKSFNSDQKNKMLTSLVQECEQPQNHLLSVLLQDKLHINCPTNCQDFLFWLPRILSYKILTYLGNSDSLSSQKFFYCW